MAHTDASGNLISRTTYEPYGYVAAGATPDIGFTGHVNDADSGLTYMQQRYYDPVAGRFLSIDPVTADAATASNFNRYAYAANNPYKNVDADGRTPIDIALLVWDIGKLGGALYSGVGIGPTMIDVAISAGGVFSPVPGAGEIYKAVRIGETVRAAEKGAEVASLGERMTEVHSALHPIAQRMGTTTVLETEEGTRIFAAGAKADLTPAQRAML